MIVNKFSSIPLFLCFLMALKDSLGQGIQNKFCDESLDDLDLMNGGYGGLFNFNDTFYAVRKDIVWKFKLEVILTQRSYTSTQKIIETTTWNKLFRGLGLNYFVSGFAITEVDDCGDNSDVCQNTKQMLNLAVIIGPKIDDSIGQKFTVCKFNGTFNRVNISIDTYVPFDLEEEGNTKFWFKQLKHESTPTAFDSVHKDLIAFNSEQNKIKKKHIGKYDSQKLEPQSWTNYADFEMSFDDVYLKMIEVEVKNSDQSAGEKKIFLITKKSVYKLEKNLTQFTPVLIEGMTNWKFLGCDPKAKPPNKPTQDPNAKSSSDTTRSNTNHSSSVLLIVSKFWLSFFGVYIIFNIKII